jgi:hypothetical protein
MRLGWQSTVLAGCMFLAPFLDAAVAYSRSGSSTAVSENRWASSEFMSF